ncbi:MULTISPECIES: hypothetical protein [unclassified Cryobacterium]|uniref:hypothetical protein n=1 Tax=unclassified Cryobacterium TaxID=2649013 RepID=UPI001F0B9222|nr:MULTISPECIES: hypothetical protein [unclassified Cryobacterium]
MDIVGLTELDLADLSDPDALAQIANTRDDAGRRDDWVKLHDATGIHFKSATASSVADE